MSEPSIGEVTELLHMMSVGKAKAQNDLLSLVYEELKAIASAKLRYERPNNTLEPTALIHEAYLRLFSSDSPITFQNRRHFFSIAAEAMRRVLVDAARKRSAAKRSALTRCQSMDIEQVQTPQEPAEFLALHAAIDELEAKQPEIAELVKLRYFTGLTRKEAAECLEISPRTADNYWAYAKVFLLKAIEADGL